MFKLSKTCAAARISDGCVSLGEGETLVDRSCCHTWHCSRYVRLLVTKPLLEEDNPRATNDSVLLHSLKPRTTNDELKTNICLAHEPTMLLFHSNILPCISILITNPDAYSSGSRNEAIFPHQEVVIDY